ncbi:LOW QUALITY PROTEIN: hypothetical protein HID58_022347 [Brassica napus]|uniref:Uncharacterized protein n=1 Tax=Brassica napus TaxID=3708 RepID=A0ABQ8CZ07_BRANA|nr:LOW QUALITY PROTEIN: hypothetical protein HID58_022347 [Brassica napus]
MLDYISKIRHEFDLAKQRFLNTSKALIICLRCNPQDGVKTVEVRCFEAEYDRLQQRGSLVIINHLMFEVMEMHKYSSFYELLKAKSPENVFPGTNTLEDCMQMFKKWCDVHDQEKKNNGVFAIHLSKSVSQPCAALSHILSGLSYTAVQSLLGLSHTIGSIRFYSLPLCFHINQSLANYSYDLIYDLSKQTLLMRSRATERGGDQEDDIHRHNYCQIFNMAHHTVVLISNKWLLTQTNTNVGTQQEVVLTTILPVVVVIRPLI